MSDDVSDIAGFYSVDPEKEDGRLDRHQLEHDLTWRYLSRYLPAQGAVLEIGAATGRYTVELARRGYSVTAVDLSAALIEQCRSRITVEGLAERVQFAVADARDLGAVGDKHFDAALLMGPLYHLIVKADREAALKQVSERLVEGGRLFSTFLSRYGIIGDLLRKHPDWIESQAEVRALLSDGKRPDEFPRGGFRGYFARLDEIVPLHEGLGFETLAVSGVDPAISADDESYNRLAGRQRQLWLDLLYEISAEPSIIAASRHILYIGKKKVIKRD